MKELLFALLVSTSLCAMKKARGVVGKVASKVPRLECLCSIELKKFFEELQKNKNDEEDYYTKTLQGTIQGRFLADKLFELVATKEGVTFKEIINSLRVLYFSIGEFSGLAQKKLLDDLRIAKENSRKEKNTIIKKYPGGNRSFSALSKKKYKKEIPSEEGVVQMMVKLIELQDVATVSIIQKNIGSIIDP